MASDRKKFKELRVEYRYADGGVEVIGRMMLGGDFWKIRYHRVDVNKGAKDVEESTEFEGEELAAVLLLERWWNEMRKWDADSVLKARKRHAEMSTSNVRQFLSYGLYDAVVDNLVREAHRALDNGVAPWEWWETIGREYQPPAGFGCRCALMGINRIRAARMLQTGEAVDLTKGIPPVAVPDRRWNTWRSAFLEAWEQGRKLGLSRQKRKNTALAEAKNSIAFDPNTEKSFLRWRETH